MKKVMLILLLVTVAMVGWSVRPASMVAEEAGVTCGWCVEFSDSSGAWFHGFNDSQGDLCGFPNPFTEEYGNVYCARCGGTSTCHVTFGESAGRCHQACGSDQASMFQRPIQDAIDSGDPRTVIVALQSLDSGVSAEFSAEGGRIDLIAECDQARAALTFVVPAEMRSRLSALLAADESLNRSTE